MTEEARLVTKKAPLVALRVVRFGLGAISWFAPSTTAKLMLLDAPNGTSERYLMRLFGVRDALMGVYLLAEDDDRLRRNLAIGVAVDLIDVTAAVISAKDSNAPALGVVYRCVAGLIGASLGAGALGNGPLAIGSPSKPRTSS
jgi:hypothetical protein